MDLHEPQANPVTTEQLMHIYAQEAAAGAPHTPEDYQTGRISVEAAINDAERRTTEDHSKIATAITMHVLDTRDGHLANDEGMQGPRTVDVGKVSLLSLLNPWGSN